jgi:V8-like Glu-specific endopeptidase
VALGDSDGAFDHALEYARDRQADAFEIGSLLRQLTEVWQLSLDESPGNVLLPILKSALLKREGGTIKVAAKALVKESNSAEASSKRLERVFGTDRYQPLGWLKTGLKRCEAVGAVETVTGKRIGTGFLVKASDFFPGRNKSEFLFLTNAHVISPVDNPFPGAIPVEAAQVVFEAMNKRYDATEIVWSSSPFDLDATFVSLDGMETSAEVCPLTPAPEAFDASKKPRVYVIGYPLGGPLSVSLQDSYWIDVAEPFLHYRTPTEPGSSGSPVFDEQYWTVIGLHHAGEKDPRFKRDENDEANEAIAIAAIQQRTHAASAAANT